VRIPQQEIVPGDWQTDENGRRFRKVGNVIEYEMEINGIPRSQFFASQKANKEAREAQQKAEQQRMREAAAVRRDCPFNDNLHRDCTREQCALFNGKSCTFASLTPAKDTEGLTCPFNKYHYKCRKDCALYHNGCTLTGIATKNEREDH
jgi:hypothetical protein